MNGGISNFSRCKKPSHFLLCDLGVFGGQSLSLSTQLTLNQNYE